MITAADGLSLLGIRVLWKIKPVYLKCSFSSLRVELRSDADRLHRDITVNDNSAEFYSTICNRRYTSKVIARHSGLYIENIGEELFYGGSL